ncbi:hypothetical protein Hanom_Chr17g01554741 [Helianthus anomalus]
MRGKRGIKWHCGRSYAVGLCHVAKVAIRDVNGSLGQVGNM